MIMAPLPDRELADILEPSLAAPKEKKNDFFFDKREQRDAIFKSVFENFKNCTYLSPNSDSPNHNNSLTILHLNIRSLNKNFDELYDFLVSFRLRPDVICLTETRIYNDPLDNITIPQYKFFHVDSQSSAGGVAVYVSDNITCKLCPDQYIMSNSECLWLELCKSNSTEKFIVGTVYRHPDQSTVKIFVDGFSDCLNDLCTSSKPYYTLGDFNINMLKSKRTSISHDYINLIVANGAVPTITKPRRVTPEFSSIIDHITTNDSIHQIDSFIFKVDVTEHYPILCKIDERKSNNLKNHPDEYYGDKSKFAAESFCEDLEKKTRILLY